MVLSEIEYKEKLKEILEQVKEKIISEVIIRPLEDMLENKNKKQISSQEIKAREEINKRMIDEKKAKFFENIEYGFSIIVNPLILRFNDIIIDCLPKGDEIKPKECALKKYSDLDELTKLKDILLERRKIIFDLYNRLDVDGVFLVDGGEAVTLENFYYKRLNELSEIYGPSFIDENSFIKPIVLMCEENDLLAAGDDINVCCSFTNLNCNDAPARRFSPGQIEVFKKKVSGVDPEKRVQDIKKTILKEYPLKTFKEKVKKTFLERVDLQIECVNIITEIAKSIEKEKLNKVLGANDEFGVHYGKKKFDSFDELI